MKLVAKQHEKIAENLKLSCINKNDRFIAYFKHTRITCMNEYDKCFDVYMKSEESLKKPKLKYENQLKKAKDKFSQRKELTLLEDEKEEYKHHVNEANSSMKKFYEEQLPGILNKIQSLEDKRIDTIKNILNDSISIEDQSLQSIKTSIEEMKSSINNISSAKDDKLIEDLFKTGRKLPNYHSLEDIISIKSVDETTLNSKTHNFDETLPREMLKKQKEYVFLKKLETNLIADKTPIEIKKIIENEKYNLNKELTKFEAKKNFESINNNVQNQTAIGLFNYKARKGTNEINMTENDVLTILDKDVGDGWTKVRKNNNEIGDVPTSYLKIESKQKQISNQNQQIKVDKDQFSNLYANVEDDNTDDNLRRHKPLPEPPKPENTLFPDSNNSSNNNNNHELYMNLCDTTSLILPMNSIAQPLNIQTPPPLNIPVAPLLNSTALRLNIPTSSPVNNPPPLLNIPPSPLNSTVSRLTIPAAPPLNIRPPPPLNSTAPPLNIPPPPPLNSTAPRLNIPQSPLSSIAPPLNIPAAPPLNIPAAPPLNIPAAPPLNIPAAPPLNIRPPPPLNSTAPRLNIPQSPLSSIAPRLNIPAAPPLNIPAAPPLNIPPPPPLNLTAPPLNIPPPPPLPVDSNVSDNSNCSNNNFLSQIQNFNFKNRKNL